MDKLAAAFHQYLEHHPMVEPRRICALSGSHLALRLAELVGERLACVAAGSPWVTDPITHFYCGFTSPRWPDSARNREGWLSTTAGRCTPA